MNQSRKGEKNILLNPEDRLCPAFDSCSIKLQLTPSREEMGIPILDNCAEEHQQ